MELEPLHKLFFIYLFTNERTSVSGIYELTKKIMVFESGLTENEINEAFKVFEAAEKAYYDDGVVWVVNFRKYHETKSPKLQAAILDDVLDVKDGKLRGMYCEKYGIDTVSEIEQMSRKGYGIDTVSGDENTSKKVEIGSNRSRSRSSVRSRSNGDDEQTFSDERPGYQELLNAVIEACRKIDPLTLSDNDLDNIETLYNLQVAPEEIKIYYGYPRGSGKSWWYDHDWRGKRAQFPTSTTIVETIGQARAFQEEGLDQEGEDTAAAEEAWKEFERYVRGNIKADALQDPKSRKAISHFGGSWEIHHNWLEKDLPYRKKDFIKFYCS